MKNGFLKVASASPCVTVADCSANVKEIISIAEEAYAQGVRLLVFPELCITGYTCADLFLTDTLLKSAEAALGEFLETANTGDMISIIGLPLFVNGKIYNCAAICQKNNILGVVPKENLSNYGEFAEPRWFSTYQGEELINLCGCDTFFDSDLVLSCNEMPEFKIGVEICEDLWAAVPPSAKLCSYGATVIANLAASSEAVGKQESRRTLVKARSESSICGYIFANAFDGESTTDTVFSGHSIIAENGNIIAERKPFDFSAKRYTVTELDLGRIAYERRRNNTFICKDPDDKDCEIGFSMELIDTTLTRKIERFPFIPTDANELYERCETILSIQAQGLKQRIIKAYAKNCVIGISGGLDSCLALLVCARAMDMLGRPRTDILGVTMPCFGTTKRTKSNAEILCNELGVEFKCVDISRSVRAHLEDIGHSEEIKNVVYENAQARERTQVIMDIANMTGGIVVGTGDLSELALGWATYNGDHMSMYGVNGGVPKTLIRYIVAHCANKAEREGKDALAAVLRDILDTPVSPELLPADDKGEIAQKTEDIVGPYEIHDFYLFYMLRYGMTPDKLYRLAKAAFVGVYDNETLLKWLRNFVRRFFAQQFKRSCLPDGPKVGSVAVSPRGDLKMPSDASAAEWLKIVDTLKA